MVATEHDGASLASRVRALVADVEGVVAESEQRLVYRREHGRQLSQPHVDALGQLEAQLVALTARLDQLLGPDVDALRKEFEELQQRLGREE